MNSTAKIVSVVILFVLVIGGLAWLLVVNAHPAGEDSSQASTTPVVTSTTTTITATTTTTTVTTPPAKTPIVVSPTPVTKKLSITSITPTSGTAGTIVTLYGTGFNSTSQVVIGNGGISNVQVNKSGTILTFTMPDSLGAYCLPEEPCPMYLMMLQPGTYTLNVRNANGMNSNGVSYTLIGNETSF
ncbi:MAG: hypothetical protein ABIT47_03635 [Candidatus Paceibacterota bacterium]